MSHRYHIRRRPRGEHTAPQATVAHMDSFSDAKRFALGQSRDFEGVVEVLIDGEDLPRFCAEYGRPSYGEETARLHSHEREKIRDLLYGRKGLEVSLPSHTVLLLLDHIDALERATNNH